MKFVIPIIPTAQMRARHAVRGTFATTYKAPEQRSREETLKAFLAQVQPVAPLEGPLLLGVRAYLPMPKMNRRDTEAALAGDLRPVTKPDLDNLLKQIKDCLSQMLFWGDDKQVVGYLPHTGKYYSDRPRWEIEIVPWNPPRLRPEGTMLSLLSGS